MLEYISFVIAQSKWNIKWSEQIIKIIASEINDEFHKLINMVVIHIPGRKYAYPISTWNRSHIKSEITHTIVMWNFIHISS